MRVGISERGRAWAVGIPFKQKVYPNNVTMIFPVAGRGRPRKNAIPDVKSVSAKAMLETAKWRKVSWRRGTKGPLSARFAAVRVKAADGPPQRIHDMGAQHLPGEEVWLVGERRSTGERKYYLSNLPANTPLTRCRRRSDIPDAGDDGSSDISLSDQSRPIKTRTTRMIRMIPMTPTPP